MRFMLFELVEAMRQIVSLSDKIEDMHYAVSGRNGLAHSGGVLTVLATVDGTDKVVGRFRVSASGDESREFSAELESIQDSGVSVMMLMNRGR